MFFGNLYQKKHVFLNTICFFFQKKHCFFAKKSWQKKRLFFFISIFFWFLWLENGKSLSVESKYSIKVSICAGKSSRCNLFIVICLTQMSTDKPCCALLIQGCKLELEPKKLERFVEFELDKIIFGTRIHLLEHVGVQANKVKCRILWLSTARVKIINLLKESNIFVSCFSEHRAVKRI